jgi:hypothetical protein
MDIEETDVRTALKTFGLGFLHSFTSGGRGRVEQASALCRSHRFGCPEWVDSGHKEVTPKAR